MLEIGSFLWSTSAERLSLLLWQTSFPFTIHAYWVISYRLVIKLSVVALFPFVVLFCHNLIRYLPSRHYSHLFHLVLQLFCCTVFLL